ncbi:MAG: glycosyltransferase [Nitrospirae bacterium]|nr:glycosyltransferase [Nitrospirota bacterium]
MPEPTIRDNRPHGKRLALFIPSLAGGGVARFTLNLAKSFASRGHKIDLLLCRVAGPYLDQIPEGVTIVKLKACSGWRGRRSALAADYKAFRELMLPILLPYKAPKPVNFLPDLVRYLQSERPDALFSAKTPCNLVALWANRLAGGSTRIVVSERSSLSPIVQSKKEWRWRFVPPIIRRVYPWADGIISVSKGVGDDVSLLTGIPRERITTIYNPIMNLEIHNKSLSPVKHPWFVANDLPIILGVGRLVLQKDFPCLLRAFRHVRSARRARLVILGEGRLRRELEALAQTLGISQDVSMPGFTENPYAFMARASVLALSSAWEGFGNVIGEALACGCPVVSTDCPSGPAEVLKNGAYGTLVPVGDDKALAEAILAVLDKPPDRARLRARASEFNLDPISEEYLQLLLADPTSRVSSQNRD